MAATHRHRRILSAFNHSSRRWDPVPSSGTQRPVMQRIHPAAQNPDTASTPGLSLVSWNIDAFSPRPVARAKLILSHILEAPGSADVVFLQEVVLGVRDSLLNDYRVRDAFYVTDAEDQASFEDVPFTTMTLLSSGRFASGVDSQKEGDGFRVGGKLMLGSVSRIGLPSKYGRDALSLDTVPPTAPDTVLRLINVHLDSLRDTLHYRAQQIEILANVLREPGCSDGVISGDFNAISPQDASLVDKNRLVDAWLALHGTAHAEGATWGVGKDLRDGRAPGRLDKVAMLGVKPVKMEVLRPGSIEVPRPAQEPLEIPWSDHSGLRCSFTV